jgi:Spx/MgsR family transcriptional regulator
MTGAHGQWAWLGFRKALKWLELARLQILRPDLDYKKYGIKAEKLKEWCDLVGWEVLLNKKSTTWRSLSVEEQQLVKNEKVAIQLMIQYPSIIKRPVIEMNGKLVVGLNEDYFSL